MTTSDRELLELAAKAARYNVRWHESWDCFVHVDAHNITNPPTLAGQRMVWVPNDDEGDALRLAVRLRINIGHTLDLTTGEVVGVLACPAGRGDCLADERATAAINHDAATRRAIVRAAAKIGRSMS